MTKTHYEAIANMIRHILGGTPYFHAMVDTMVSYFKDDNKLFNESTFREACRTNPDCDGENRPEIKIKENTATKEIEERIRKYQKDTYGAEAATKRMNKYFEKLNEKIQEEKKSNLR